MRLHHRSACAGLIHLAVHLGALLLSSLWIMSGAPLWWIALVPQGLLLVFLFTLEHECTHDTPFPSPRFCRLVGTACGVILITPFTWFRYFHLAHHKHTNDPARDPELLSGAKPETWPALIWHVTGLPLWVGMIRQTINNALGRTDDTYVPAKAAPRVRREARFMITLYSSVIASLFWTDAALWLWIIPCLIGQPVLRLYLLAEHGRCPPVANMLENTRTTYTNRFVRWLAWNMPYHIEHHSAPGVPFHNLPALHAIMRGALITTSPSYTAFTKDYASKLTLDN